mmetsp:Transcript_36478/g.91851  ORF Transcript_36478/g.91851 Transcript_36478/m.91851 type:complete len:371 (+) Transcript_36478:183-1295(+)
MGSEGAADKRPSEWVLALPALPDEPLSKPKVRDRKAAGAPVAPMTLAAAVVKDRGVGTTSSNVSHLRCNSRALATLSSSSTTTSQETESARLEGLEAGSVSPAAVAALLPKSATEHLVAFATAAAVIAAVAVPPPLLLRAMQRSRALTRPTTSSKVSSWSAIALSCSCIAGTADAPIRPTVCSGTASKGEPKLKLPGPTPPLPPLPVTVPHRPLSAARKATRMLCDSLRVALNVASLPERRRAIPSMRSVKAAVSAAARSTLCRAVAIQPSMLLRSRVRCSANSSRIASIAGTCAVSKRSAIAFWRCSCPSTFTRTDAKDVRNSSSCWPVRTSKAAKLRSSEEVSGSKRVAGNSAGSSLTCGTCGIPLSD